LMLQAQRRISIDAQQDARIPGTTRFWFGVLHATTMMAQPGGKEQSDFLG